MPTYRVVWECDVEAESPHAAALEAESIMHDYSTDGHRPVLDVYSSANEPNARLAATVLVLSDANHEVLWEQIDLEEPHG